MPVYRYRCPECSTVTEVVAPMTKAPPDNSFKCDKCGAKVRRDYKGEAAYTDFHPTKGSAR